MRRSSLEVPESDANAKMEVKDDLGLWEAEDMD